MDKDRFNALMNLSKDELVRILIATQNMLVSKEPNKTENHKNLTE